MEYPKVLSQGLIRMARRQRQKSGNPMIRWWESQRDNHLNILYSVTLIGLGGLLWGLSFFLFLDGVNEYADLIGVTWAILLIGAIALSIAAPELFRYRNQLMILNEVLDLESRATINKRRKEAEEAATLLGTVHQGRLLAHYEKFNIRAGRAFAPTVHAHTLEDSMISEWWNSDNSILSVKTGMEGLSNPTVHRTVIVSTFTSMVLLIWNGLIGLVRMESDGPRDHALDLGAWLNRNLGGDVSSVTRETPGFDVISILVLALLLGVFYSTRPAGETPTSLEEE